MVNIPVLFFRGFNNDPGDTTGIYRSQLGYVAAWGNKKWQEVNPSANLKGTGRKKYLKMVGLKNSLLIGIVATRERGTTFRIRID